MKNYRFCSYLVLCLMAVQCSGEGSEINQKTLSALPINQKSGLPEVILANPPSGTNNVPKNTPITIVFGTRVNTSSVESAFVLRKTSDNSIVPGSFSWNMGTTFTFTPASLLDFGENYQISISGAKTALGKDLTAYNSVFKVGNDGIPPTVVTSAPGDGVGPGPVVVSLDWSELINEAIALANCVFDGVPCNATDVTWTGNTMKYNTNVACDQTHTLSFGYIEDATGTPTSYAKTFSTAATTICKSCDFDTGCCEQFCAPGSSPCQHHYNEPNCEECEGSIPNPMCQ